MATRRVKSLNRAVSVAAIAATIGGCVSSPDFSRIRSEVSSIHNPPRIVSAEGELSRHRRKEIMERLRASSQSDLLQRHEAVLELVGGTPLTKGNRVTLLLDGQSSYAAMFRAIDEACASVNVESYKMEDDETGRKFVELLLKKRAEGVPVNLMYDSIGTLLTPKSFFGRLRAGGVTVVEVLNLPHADHRKMLIVDGKIVITGGVNISQVYASTPLERKPEQKRSIPWRDTDIRIEGPAAREFQKLFVDSWHRQKGPDLSGPAYFPEPTDVGSALVRAVAGTPGQTNRINYLSYLAAITYSEHSVHIANAYFIPDEQIFDALADAAKRGVDVKIIVPSVTDSKLALYAMQANYTDLLETGIKLYERRGALLHAKTAVIDGVWSTVGSTNLDYLSLLNNYEVNAVVLGRDFASEMEESFAKDLQGSTEITMDSWKKRSLMQHFREFFGHLLSHFL